jgi:glycosyltransferase involved in cell wall biosynthesis
MQSPWLSVVMPTYNASNYLREALASVAKQANGEVEIIAVDDGSTDDTITIFQSYRSRLPITILGGGPHKGNNSVANCNRGLRLAKAPYACQLHHDDLWFSGRLESIRKSIQRFPEAILHIHPAWFINEKGNRLGLWRCPVRTHRLLSPKEMFRKLIVQNFLASGVPVFRREVAEQVGFFDEQILNPPDWDLWLKLAQIGPTVCTSTPLFGYRLHTKSITSMSPQRLQSVKEELMLVLNRHLSSESLTGEDEVLRKISQFSVEFNVSLFAFAGRQKTHWFHLLKLFLALGPRGWGQFFRDSRAVERILARLSLLVRMRKQFG